MRLVGGGVALGAAGGGVALGVDFGAAFGGVFAGEPPAGGWVSPRLGVGVASGVESGLDSGVGLGSSRLIVGDGLGTASIQGVASMLGSGEAVDFVSLSPADSSDAELPPMK